MNPIISMMNRQNPVAAMLQPIYSAMQGAQNPMAAIGQMANSDERMQRVVDAIRQNGGVQQAVYAEAQKQNVNPNDVLNQARQMIQAFNVR